MTDMKVRRAATQKTIDRYRGKAFDWGKGVTCVHMARVHLRNMGHKVPAIPRFRSAFGAKAALVDRGWGDCCEMLDSMLPRIAPAYATLGDLIAVEGEAGIDALFICAGPRRFFGWREDCESAVMLEIDLNDCKGAWRG